MKLRSVIGGWFALIVLYTVVTKADATTGILGTASTALKRIGDPNVPLIPGTRLGVPAPLPSNAPSGVNGPVTGVAGGTGTPTPTGIQGPKIPITL